MKGSRKEIGERDDHRVGVSLFLLYVEKAFGAGAAGFIDGDDWPRRELMLVSDAADQPGHLISAAARPGRYDKLNWLRRLPSPCSVHGRKNNRREEP